MSQLSDFATAFARELPFAPTDDQSEAIARISAFLLDSNDRSAFILRGYAGTGKTTIVAALVRLLHSRHKRPILLAPTGRAAKVFGLYAKAPAYTIHKMIYRQRTFEGESTRFEPAPNKRTNTLFIVDEASMLSNSGGGLSLFGTGCLMDDLINHVYEGSGCRLLLVGDTAQLPPVGDYESPALQIPTIEDYGLSTSGITLRHVVRQTQYAGILWNATGLRSLLEQGGADEVKLRFTDFDDVQNVRGSELIEELQSCYDDAGTAETIVVTRSNKRANLFNNGIRSSIFFREGELTKGDIVMVAKNNYYWAEMYGKDLPASERPPFDFIANGDIAEVVHIYSTEEMYGFRFADVCLSFPDYNDYEIEVRVILDTLQAEAPALTREQSEALFQEVVADYSEFTRKGDRMKKVRENPYYNAVQIKYAYAVTCHKAQGGQWRHVFVDQGSLGDGHDPSYLRWLYTAITRSSECLYLVNWPEAQSE